MDQDKARDEAREAVRAMPAETAAGNVDADSHGPDTTFPETASDKEPDTTE